ncbi:gpW protein [Paraburkholderia sp. BL8N3]|nr:gpW family head-tail joining protein [Paraburkholderia sp. BL8N3]TCK39658.1 gpW protein [Paraburkholderia sp. BL8N3]
MFDPSTSIFAGMSQEALQQALSNAQAALIALQTGTKGVSFSYTQGDGAKSVTYQQTDIAALTALIRQLQQQLGIICRARRPVRFVYR